MCQAPPRRERQSCLSRVLALAQLTRREILARVVHFHAGVAALDAVAPALKQRWRQAMAHSIRYHLVDVAIVGETRFERYVRRIN